MGRLRAADETPAWQQEPAFKLEYVGGNLTVRHAALTEQTRDAKKFCAVIIQKLPSLTVVELAYGHTTIHR